MHGSPCWPAPWGRQENFPVASTGQQVFCVPHEPGSLGQGGGGLGLLEPPLHPAEASVASAMEAAIESRGLAQRVMIGLGEVGGCPERPRTYSLLARLSRAVCPMT